MQYTIEVPEVMGEVFFLYRIAEAMAKRAANAGDKGFHQAAYKQMLGRYIGDLVSGAQEGRLKVCNQTGAIRTPDEILADAKEKHGLVSSLKDTSETVALNVCVSLRQLNIWAHERGNDFQITHEGVPWIDERGWINGEMELKIDIRPVSDEHLSAPTEKPRPHADDPVNAVTEPIKGSGNIQRWTPAFTAEVKAYRNEYGTQKASAHFQVSAALIRKKLPGEKPSQKGYGVFTHHTK